jgi:hypothetical protein
MRRLTRRDGTPRQLADDGRARRVPPPFHGHPERRTYPAMEFGSGMAR